MNEQRKWFLEMESTGEDAMRVTEMTTKDLAYDTNLDGKAASGFERTDSSFERHSINTVRKMLSTSISRYREIIHDRKMWLCHSHPKLQQPLPQSVSSHKYRGKAYTTNKKNSLKIQMLVSKREFFFFSN